MLVQLPPYAIATPVFRFRALAMHAGRAPLGGEREIALACYVVARLVAGTLPPFMLSPAESTARATSAKHWLASLALPGNARAAASSAIDGVGAGNRRAAGTALRHLTDIAASHLDQSSVNELNEVISELSAS
jgi:hypothetical protein